jgi:predicted phosphoribosyltransferase
MNKTFPDRAHAGRLLAGTLEKYAGGDNVIVLALPRGGVPVGYEVARKLGVALDVVLVRKLSMPGQPGRAVGAVAAGGVSIVNEVLAYELDLSRSALTAMALAEEEELRRRQLAYRGSRPKPDLRDKTAIVVDDGIATGSTVRAVVRALRKENPSRVIVAAPVASSHSVELIRAEVDEVAVLHAPQESKSIAEWYDRFEAVTDADVIGLLDEFRKRHGDAAAWANNDPAE